MGRGRGPARLVVGIDRAPSPFNGSVAVLARYGVGHAGGRRSFERQHYRLAQCRSRRIVEGGIHGDRLRQHQDLEIDARRRDDKRAVIRLSGEFHSLAAELAGNTALARNMRELSVLTCLMIFLYDSPTATSCRADEHSQIIEAIAKRDSARAERLMLEHLEHIENSMNLEVQSEEVDLEAVFRG